MLGISKENISGKVKSTFGIDAFERMREKKASIPEALVKGSIAHFVAPRIEVYAHNPEEISANDLVDARPFVTGIFAAMVVVAVGSESAARNHFDTLPEMMAFGKVIYNVTAELFPHLPARIQRSGEIFPAIPSQGS